MAQEVRQDEEAGDADIELSVVVPVYRSAQTLVELHRRIGDSLVASRIAFEVIFVDDAGGDGSWQVIEGLARTDSHVRGIRLSRNFGQHAATICGFANARGRWIATMDDDLEQSPEDLPLLLARAREGADLVYGVYPSRTHQGWRNATSALARALFRIAVPSLNYEYTSFRVVRGEVARTITRFDAPFPFVDGYLSWTTNSYSTVSVSHGVRAHGTSNYTLRKLLTHTVNIFVTFSDLPLRMASWIGLTFFAIGIGWLSVIVIGRLLGMITVSGFASLMGAIILFGGIQLLLLGVFGEYLGRMSFTSSRKPLFLIGQTTPPRRVGARE